MNPSNQLRFSLSDRIDGAEITPSWVSLALLNSFPRDVSDFLKGSSRDVDPIQVRIAIEKGSLVFVASEIKTATSLWKDLERLQQHAQSLDEIDPKRAEIIERWQDSALKNPNRRYSIGDSPNSELIYVDSKSNYRKTGEDSWVVVEKYLHGRVVDLGGETKPNVHFKLDDGTTLTIDSTQALLANEKRNWVYQSVLLHITAEENLRTGKLRNPRLLAFEPYEPYYDQDEFDRMVERGTKAWADVKDASSWVDELRGGKS